VIPIACAALTIVVTCRLGARLYGVRTGLVAGLMLATTIGFALEARTLRPDCIVIFTVTSAIFCWDVADTGDPRAANALARAMYALLGFGILAKGFVAPRLVAAPIGVTTLLEHGPRGLARCRPFFGIAVLAAVVLPWHLAAALANPGFAWDYVVNQHLLFALDKKEPRDSEGDTLAFFLQAFVLRASPWVLFAPFALGDAVARRRCRARAARRACSSSGSSGSRALLAHAVASRALLLPALPAVAFSRRDVPARPRRRRVAALRGGRSRSASRSSPAASSGSATAWRSRRRPTGCRRRRR
jgi:4-amino-4-deoxy-L-arabinose transferase-like glycosyltransferase